MDTDGLWNQNRVRSWLTVDRMMLTSGIKAIASPCYNTFTTNMKQRS